MTALNVRYHTQLKSLSAVALAVICFAPFVATKVYAQQIQPFSITNTRPTVLIHGIPSSRRAEITKPSVWDVDVDYDITNHFSYNFDRNESVRFDGETTRLALSLKYGIYNGAELEVLLPYYSHEGGSLDQFIEGWHDIFGFPQNGRTRSPRDQLHFFYEKNGVTKLDFQGAASGVGDVQLIFAFNLSKQWLTQQKNLTLKTAIKLPTGDSDKLTGSGGVVLSAWLAADRHSRWFDFDGRSYFSLGAMLLEEADIISDQQQPVVLFGGLGTGVEITHQVALQLQLDSHTPLYKGSDLKELGSVSFLLSMGGNYRFNANWNLDVAVVEDILPQAAPDVIFHLGVSGRW